MYVTWTALRSHEPGPVPTWHPEGAVFAQHGAAGPGRADVPTFDGRWWSVLAVWDDEPAARAAAPDARAVDADVWHVLLQPAAFRGDAVLSGGARPFAGLPAAGKTTGASAVVTLAGLGSDPARTGEFLERVVALGSDVQQAAGLRAALVQAPSDGAVLTFSAWSTLRDAVTWAYHRPQHAATVARQAEHGLLETSGFLRCAVLDSSGMLGDVPDPLAGLRGAVVPRQERS